MMEYCSGKYQMNTASRVVKKRDQVIRLSACCLFAFCKAVLLFL